MGDKESYFHSYSDINVHTLMLRDEPRTNAYKTYIENNKALFEDKIVIDVGAGTGILSLFAAKAGAKQVYAIEASDIATLCEQIVKKNELEDKVTVIRGRMEDVTLPAGTQADVIISEWMGFYLFHEGMLESVICARDRWLRPGGCLLPASASLYLAPVNMNPYVRENFDRWTRRYGCDLSPLIPAIKQQTYSQPVITMVTEQQLLAPPSLVGNIHLEFVTAADVRRISMTSQYTLSKNGLLHGFACWFDVVFEAELPDGGYTEAVTLTTGPAGPPTHWQQAVIFLPQPLLVNREDTLLCDVTLQQAADNSRHYDITLALPEEEGDHVTADDDTDIRDVIVQAYRPVENTTALVCFALGGCLLVIAFIRLVTWALHLRREKKEHARRIKQLQNMKYLKDYSVKAVTVEPVLRAAEGGTVVSAHDKLCDLPAYSSENSDGHSTASTSEQSQEPKP